MSAPTGTVSYRDAGVDAEAGDVFVEEIGSLCRGTHRPEVLAGVGGFAGLFALPPGRWREPVLVSGTDGVGTKLKVAFAAGRHETIGIDLVAMCVNDVACCGAEPLFFLDYFATGRLERPVAVEVVRGIAAACRAVGCALIGGETAELPGFYARGEYDLAGFAVGVVERAEILDGRAVRPGDEIVGVASSGLHSNGYSLARTVVFDRMGLSLDAELPGTGRRVAEVLLEPTVLYPPLLAAVRGRVPLRGLAHITGGGLPGNLPRPLPAGLRAVVERGRWPEPPVFAALAAGGPVADDELWSTFNRGLGLCAIVPAGAGEETAAALREAAAAHPEAGRCAGAWVVGHVEERGADEPDFVLRGGEGGRA